MSSNKQVLQEVLESCIIEKIIREINEDDSTDLDEDDDDEIFILSLLALNEVRYIEPRVYNVFKSQINLLKNHPIFESGSNKLQAPTEFQLAVFLRRLETKEDIFAICSCYGIAEGTVILYCKRVMKAIIFNKEKYIKWPTTDQARNFVYEGFKAIGGIEEIIRAIDNTYFLFQNASQKDKEFYFTRKKRYALHCQGIVDFKGIFISYDVGWPGSVHNAKVYCHSSFYLNKSSFIINNDF
ncbi:7596_t:CDS:2 [Funneliformis geosporum]|uniref:7596_t:CDS:1 n=1 Tax=Funneliformis geosporum TaxID=1117311 RepID=A0A9W4T1M7_9GLOM|nr:7596_t:CDS:2 [Funneliformis geosporum]